MTPEQRKRAKELCDLATAEPWKQDGDERVCDGRCGDPFRYHDGSCCDHRSPVGCYVERHHNCMSVADVAASADTTFIAESRSLLPAALAEIERLSALVKQACDIGIVHAAHNYYDYKDVAKLSAIRAAVDEGDV